MKGFKSIQPKLKIAPKVPAPTEIEPITIKEPYNPEVRSFEDTEDFTRYFRENEDSFKEPQSDPEKTPHFLTTNKLNRAYKIPGYRIRIIHKGTDKEELTLVKDYYNKIPSNDEPSTDTNNEDTLERIDQLQSQIDDILERINNIESFLVQLKR